MNPFVLGCLVGVCGTLVVFGIVGIVMGVFEEATGPNQLDDLQQRVSKLEELLEGL